MSYTPQSGADVVLVFSDGYTPQSAADTVLLFDDDSVDARDYITTYFMVL